MTTSSPTFRVPVRQVAVSRFLAGSVGTAVAVALFVGGAAQLLLPGLRNTMAEVYVGVPSWVFLLAGIYQLSAAAMIMWPRTRVSGAMHAAVIALATVGFNLFGVGTLALIPLNVGATFVALAVAWYYSFNVTNPGDV